jgi:aquaporin Z
MESYKKYLAEMLGTMTLVFIGCGSAVIAGGTAVALGGVGLVGISLAFGLAVLAMAFAIGGVSGCHINPAVTIAMLVGKKISGKDAAAYIAMQCVGAIIGAALLFVVATGQVGNATAEAYHIEANGLGQNGYEDGSPMGYTMVACFVAEVILTMIFLLVIFGSTSKLAPPGFAGIPIGLSLAMIHIVGIPITGTSVNPARSLGPAVMVGGESISQLWLFWVAPIIGAVMAAVVWVYVLERE